MEQQSSLCNAPKIEYKAYAREFLDGMNKILIVIASLELDIDGPISISFEIGNQSDLRLMEIIQGHFNHMHNYRAVSYSQPFINAQHDVGMAITIEDGHGIHSVDVIKW